MHDARASEGLDRQQEGGTDGASLSDSESPRNADPPPRNRAAEEFARIEAAVHAALPVEAAWRVRACFDLSPILRCIRDGADLERDVVPVIREVSRRVLERGQSISHWRFFETAIRDLMRSRGVSRDIKQVKEPEWETHLRRFISTGYWPRSLGPAPGWGGCRAPPDLVARVCGPMDILEAAE